MYNKNVERKLIKMNRKKIIEWHNGEQYELNAYIGCFGCMIEVDIRRVTHPERKFFRTVSEDTRSFFIDDYETLEEGCKHCFEKFIKAYEEEIARRKKINNFFKKA